MFKDRTEAGIQLSQKLRSVLSEENSGSAPAKSVVVALPRGGVTVAVEVARRIQLPLTVLVAKKIGAPNHKEYAIGAVSSAGVVVLNEDTKIPQFILRPYIESERKRLMEQTKIAELKWLESAGRAKQFDFRGVRAIIVDDGVATGMTTVAAEKSLRELGAKEVFLATPVIAAETVKLLGNNFDRIIALTEPFSMGAVGFFYDDFHQITDDEVKLALSSFSLEN